MNLENGVLPSTNYDQTDLLESPTRTRTRKRPPKNLKAKVLNGKSSSKEKNRSE